MAKKKRTTKNAAPEEVTLTPELLGRARAAIEKLDADLPYNKAKMWFRHELGIGAGEANALQLQLRAEGFKNDDAARVFLSDTVQSFRGIVRGARTADMMTVVREDDSEKSWPLEDITYDFVLPGDVLELRPQVRYGNTPRLVRVIERTRKRWICRAVKGWKATVWQSVNPFAPVEFNVDASTLPKGLPAGCVIEVEIIEEKLAGANIGNVPARYVRTVGQANDPLGEVAIASAEHGVPVEFSAETLEEAAALPDTVPAKDMKGRVDLTDIPFVTIDGEDARDFDDAVWCRKEEGGWRLLVAIADVSAYVKPKSALDRDAQARGTSVYFPSSVVPMLPEKLSNGLCSLNPGVDRLTMVCDAVVGEDGLTKAYQFYPAVIHSHARLTYTQVWSALTGEKAGLDAVGERIAELRELHALFKVLRAAREKRNALDFETPESQALFDASGQIEGFRVREHNDTHRLIEECMLVANVCAADFVIRKKKHTLFRVHPKPELERLRLMHQTLRALGWSAKAESPEQLAKLIRDTKDKPVVQQTILRAMSRAVYQPENVGHFGLQYEAYAHFTSPIRRYPDLLLHRTIKGILSRRTYVPEVVFDDAAAMAGYHATKLTEERTKAAAAKKPGKTAAKTTAADAAWVRLGVLCSAAERRADDASRDVMQYLKCVFTRKAFAKKTAKARVTGMIPAGLFVTLEDMPIEGFVHISNIGWGYYEYDEQKCTMSSSDEMRTIKIGHQVEVELESVEIETRRINFKLKGAGRRERRGRRWSWDSYDERFFDDEDDFDDFDDDDDFY